MYFFYRMLHDKWAIAQGGSFIYKIREPDIFYGFLTYAIIDTVNTKNHIRTL